MGKRINTLNTASSPANDDYLPIDGATNGTRKISADFMNNLITDVEVDGTSVVTSGVAEIDLSGKQDTLTAGSNITIAQDGTISATDTTYTAGTNVDITGGVISATDTTYTAGTNVTIDANNVISASDTTYTAGTNVQINNGVISATDTTYSAFDGATAGADGSSGLVPQPLIADKDKFLKGDGTWDTIQPGASALDDLTNVDITSPTNGQVLKYDSTNQEWVNANESGGGGGSSAEEMTLAEYNELTTEQKNDGTIRFIPKSNIGYSLDIDFTNSTAIKELGMSSTTVNNNSVQIVWDTVDSYCGLTIYPTVKVDVTDYDFISYDFTSTNSYDSLNPGYENPVRDLGVGLRATAPSTMTLAPNMDYTVWNRYEVTDVGTTFTDERIDVSNLTGEYYLIIACAGWNATVSNIVIGTEGGNPSQIKYMDETYGISSGGEGGTTTEEIYKNTAGTIPDTINLTKPINDFDIILITGFRSNTPTWKISSFYVSSAINQGDVIELNDDAYYAWYTVTDLSTLAKNTAQYDVIDTIYGLKFGSGGGGGSDVIELTQSEYNALPDEEKNNGCIYMVSSQASTPEELTEAQTNTSTAVTASSYTYDTNLNQYHYPWCAFNRVSPNPNEMAYPTPGVTTQTCWSPNPSQDGSNSWICYHFDRAYKMTSMTINSFTDYSSSATKSVVIEGSNDGTTWTNILLTGNSFSLNSDLHTLTPNSVNLNSDTAYEYVRLRSLEPMGASYQPTVFIDEIFVYGYKSEKALKKIYYMGTEYGNTGDSTAAEEMTLDEYNALPSAQRNDGTIRFIPNGSTIAETSAIDMSSISSRKEFSMDVSSTSDQVIISWLGGNQIGGTFYYATPIDVTTWDKITFDLTTSSCYGGGSMAQQARWNVQIGLQSEIPSSVQVIDASDSRWIAVKDYANSNTTYDDQEIDVSELTGSYYLVINAHGWNAIIDDFTLEKIGVTYPSQIKYMSKTYALEGDMHTYSTTEHQVGTWIDGLDVYEKSFEIQITSTDPIIIEQDASYIDALLSFEGSCKSSAGLMAGSGMSVSTGWGFAVHRNASNQLVLYGNPTAVLNGTAYITIRYTKTSS